MKFRKKYILVVVVLLIVLLGVISQLITNVATEYLAKRENNASAVQCSATHTSHTLVISQGKVSPGQLSATLCDKLIVQNQDDVLRLMSFGEHDHHEVYDGISQMAIEKDQQFSITLNKLGTYRIHDHLHEEVESNFTVTQ